MNPYIINVLIIRRLCIVLWIAEWWPAADQKIKRLLWANHRLVRVFHSVSLFFTIIFLYSFSISFSFSFFPLLFSQLYSSSSFPYSFIYSPRRRDGRCPRALLHSRRHGRPADDEENGQGDRRERSVDRLSSSDSLHAFCFISARDDGLKRWPASTLFRPAKQIYEPPPPQRKKKERNRVKSAPASLHTVRSVGDDPFFPASHSLNQSAR